MALQHFYSRVPARVSMFRKADGFDTFACSEGLTREFIERELAPIYENKLNKLDPMAVRRGEMPDVYTQSCTRSGVLVQNCISYLPLDYTGERSAYLSHSLIYSEEEKGEILSRTEKSILHPELFVTDISGFGLTEPEAMPNGEYPETPYRPKEAVACDYLAREADPDIAISFLYAVLNAICGKGRNVSFKLPGEDKELSLASMNLYNELLSVLPISLRAGLSFASYVTEPTAYVNHKLKGVCADFPESAAAKNVYFDFQTKLIIGVRHEEVVANKALIQFFYSLLGNENLRTEFLRFAERAMATIPALAKLNLKALDSLVFLFRCSCGFYPEQEVLPNDNAVYEYLCAYEKYREAMPTDYRLRAYACLRRYAANHLAIPKNTFVKATKLYTGEDAPTKRVYMDVVLELIHVDVMRDKLFQFIRSNYETETDEMKQIIVDDLTRVFYGGFLQSRLLNFFSEIFPTEPEESRSMIVGKLLLSIRTPALKKQIPEFIRANYTYFGKEDKDSFYATCLEMLPEADELAGILVTLVNDLIKTESEQRQEALALQLTEALEHDYRRKDHLLMPILAAEPGFCRDLVIRLAFGDWKTRKLHGEYVELMGSALPGTLTRILLSGARLIDPAGFDDFLNDIIPALRNKFNSLTETLNFAETVSELPESALNRLNRDLIFPAVRFWGPDIFDVERHPGVMDRFRSYAEAHIEVHDCGAYLKMLACGCMVDAVRRDDIPSAAKFIRELLNWGETQTVADYLRGAKPERTGDGTETEVTEAQPITARMAFSLADSFLRGETPDLKTLFLQNGGQSSPAQTFEDLLHVCLPMAEADTGFAEALTGESANAVGLIQAFSDAYGRGAIHYLKQHIPEGNPFADHLNEAMAQKKANGNSFFTRLFSKRS